MRLLVIEDERALCETIVRSLRRLAYSVDYCYDGNRAIELLGEERYDLVLLDLNLPGTDGMTVLKTLTKKTLKLEQLCLVMRMRDILSLISMVLKRQLKALECQMTR